MISFDNLDIGSSIFAHPVYLEGIRIKFVHESHQVKVTVTGANKVANAYSHNVKLRSVITSVLQNTEPLSLGAA